MLSLAASTPLTALVLSTMPRVSASSNIPLRPVRPSLRVWTSATPSLSKSFIARRTRSASVPAPAKASASASICSSRGIFVSWLALSPSSLRAALASPVPWAASAVRRIKRWSAIFIVVVSTPVIVAAWCSFWSSWVVTPMRLAVLARASVASRDALTIRPSPPAPRAAVMPVLKLSRDLRTVPRLRLTDLNACAVLSTAVSFMLTSGLLAIAVRHYFKISQPLV